MGEGQLCDRIYEHRQVFKVCESRKHAPHLRELYGPSKPERAEPWSLSYSLCPTCHMTLDVSGKSLRWGDQVCQGVTSSNIEGAHKDNDWSRRVRMI